MWEIIMFSSLLVISSPALGGGEDEDVLYYEDIQSAELREEFGYNVNPHDNYMKERIAEREKALIKEEKEIKKAQKKEKKAAAK